MAQQAAGTETSGPNCRRLALLLEYDGGRYAGSQLQRNALTVQAVLEEAIVRATETPARVAFAGRTDAGVHARGQVASFVTPSRLEPAVMCRALNAWLPEDVAVLAVSEVGDDFDPRRHARRRHYRYLIHTGASRPALARSRVWHVGAELDVEAMAKAGALLVGEHDFAAFAGPMERQDASTVRRLHAFDVSRRGAVVVVDAVANAFLPHQVRRMVGSLVDVGKGKLTPAEYAAQLDGPPSSAGPAAPAQGLYLMHVEYAVPLFDEALDWQSGVC